MKDVWQNGESDTQVLVVLDTFTTLQEKQAWNKNGEVPKKKN